MTEDNTTTPQPTPAPDGILDKIQKLIAKANDSGTTEAESDAFFAKAYALMAKWQIDEAVLRVAGKRDPDDIIVRERIEGMPWTTYKHRALIWHIVAQHNNCMALVDVQARAPKVYLRDDDGYILYDKNNKPRTERKRGGITLVGYKSDLERVKLLSIGLDLHMASAGTKSIARLKGPDKYYGRESFNHGFIHTLDERMEEAYAQINEEAEASTPGVGLALIDRMEDVEAFVGETKTGRGVSLSSRANYTQYREGQAAAATADIGLKGAGSGAPKGALR